MNAGDLGAPSPIYLFWRVKLRLAFNYLRDFKRHILLHAVAGISVLLVLLLGGFFLFRFLFGFLLHEDQQPFGEPLMRRLVGMVLLAFFLMLTFSNLIIMLTTTYISREVEFFMAQPFSHRRLFFCKLGESTIYSSWAFVILSMPFFLAWGASVNQESSWLFILVTAALLLPYILIPSALGAIATLVVTVYFPAKKGLRLALVLAGLAMAIAMVTGRLSGISGGWGTDQREGIGRVMNFLGIGDMPWVPSTWLARGIRACLDRDWSEVAFWGGMLGATSLMALQICYWLAGRLYYSGYCASRSSGTSKRTRAGGFYAFFDWVARPLRPAIRALVVKDFTVFWRDPAQWGQLMVLFGLLFIYIANLGSAADLSRVRINEPIWKSLVSLFNIGATCFVLSILSTRFYFPMLSLEGKQQWVIGLAPLARTRLVWVKYGVCWACSLGLTIPLMVFSSFVLRADFYITALSLLTVFVMSMGLTSLSIGLGALLPNFNEDNPSRIANGLGGTINVLLSLFYIGVTLVLEFPLVWLYVQRSLPESGGGRAMIFSAAPLWLLVQALVITAPMALGLRNWRRLEF